MALGRELVIGWLGLGWKDWGYGGVMVLELGLWR